MGKQKRRHPARNKSAPTPGAAAAPRTAQPGPRAPAVQVKRPWTVLRLLKVALLWLLAVVAMVWPVVLDSYALQLSGLAALGPLPYAQFEYLVPRVAIVFAIGLAVVLAIDLLESIAVSIAFLPISLTFIIMQEDCLEKFDTVLAQRTHAQVTVQRVDPYGMTRVDNPRRPGESISFPSTDLNTSVGQVLCVDVLDGPMGGHWATHPQPCAVASP